MVLQVDFRSVTIEMKKTSLLFFMRQNSKVLDRLLAPGSAQKFLKAYREKDFLLVRGAHADKFHHLLTMEAIGELISSGFLRHPECKLAKNGRDIPLANFLSGDPASGVLDVDALYAEYRNGATIIVNYLNRYWQPVSEFCRQLESFFSVPVQTNVYLTPARSQGFAVHYDTHDVFILQVAGKKNWRLYDGPAFLPMERHSYQSATSEVGNIRKRCTLRAGDLLYIPRGCLHDATASDGPSLHMTVGVRSTTWGDLLTEAVSLLTQRDPSLRTSLPPGYAGHGPEAAAVRKKLPRLTAKIAARLPLEDALDEMADRFVSRRIPFLGGQFSDFDAVKTLAIDSQVERRRDALFRVWKEGSSLCLLLYRKKMVFPGFVGPALRFVLKGGVFTPREIPGRLTEKSKLVLVRSLVVEGLLRIRRPPGASLNPAPIRLSEWWNKAEDSTGRP